MLVSGDGDVNSAAGQSGQPQGVGERLSSLEERLTQQISQLLQVVTTQQQQLTSLVADKERVRVESSDPIAPGNTGSEAGSHQSGVASGAVGGMGSAQGLGVSGMRVGSSGGLLAGMNF